MKPKLIYTKSSCNRNLLGTLWGKLEPFRFHSWWRDTALPLPSLWSACVAFQSIYNAPIGSYVQDNLVCLPLTVIASGTAAKVNFISTYLMALTPNNFSLAGS